MAGSLRVGQNEGDDVRPAIAAALGSIGDSAAIPALQQAAEKDPLFDVRSGAKRAITALLKTAE